MPARMDLETVFAISMSLVTMPAASPYLVLLALLMASSIVLLIHMSYLNPPLFNMPLNSLCLWY
jgi:hypothetical protein